MIIFNRIILVFLLATSASSVNHLWAMEDWPCSNFTNGRYRRINANEKNDISFGLTARSINHCKHNTLKSFRMTCLSCIIGGKSYIKGLGTPGVDQVALLEAKNQITAKKEACMARLVEKLKGNTSSFAEKLHQDVLEGLIRIEQEFSNCSFSDLRSCGYIIDEIIEFEASRKDHTCRTHELAKRYITQYNDFLCGLPLPAERVKERLKKFKKMLSWLIPIEK